MLKLGFRLSVWCALLAMLGLILALYLPQTAQQAKQVERLLGGDAVLHVVVGALLPVALAVLARLYRLPSRWQAGYWAGCLLMFGFDELLQLLSPLRESSVGDMLMSALGWVIGMSGWFLLLSLRAQR